MSDSVGVEIEVAQKASEISQKISQLCNFEGESLKHEMQDLKRALLENPSACSLLLDEDIGKAVAALRKMVGIAVAVANAPKPKKEKAPGTKKLSAKELEDLLAEIPDSEL